MGSIPVGDSGVFSVPRSRHVEYSIFSYFFSELKFTVFLYLSIYPLFVLQISRVRDCISAKILFGNC